MTDTDPRTLFPLQPALPRRPDAPVRWGRLYGGSTALALAGAAASHRGMLVVLTATADQADRTERELRFYLRDTDTPVLHFPDWEVLPYDVFSPHQDIISRRLETLYRLPRTDRGALVLALPTLMQRIAPTGYVEGNVLSIARGERIEVEAFRRRLEDAGYRHVPQVTEHGEFAVRGAIIDLYPMGSRRPYRLDLFDDEIETIRVFDPETQISSEKLDRCRVLPAREFPFDEAAIKAFRQRYRAAFSGDPTASHIYRDVTRGISPGGIEFYLPLFFEETATLFDYLPTDATVAVADDADEALRDQWEQVTRRHDQRGHDIERPLLGPERVFLPPDEVRDRLGHFSRIVFGHRELPDPAGDDVNLPTAAPPSLRIDNHAAEPAAGLARFLDGFEGRALFAAESRGHREQILELLRGRDFRPRHFESWRAFRDADDAVGVCVAPLEQGIHLPDHGLTIVAEEQLFGERVSQRRKRRPVRDPETIIRDLADLNPGAPVVHEDHGVGRYRGLQSLTVGGVETEFLTLEYAGGDKLYVPVSSLHLISRFTGTSPEQAPLHRLGSGQWEKARRRAAEKVRDVAAELLDIHARREARKGHAFRFDQRDYLAFASEFPFEETPDQEQAIQSVIEDLRRPRPMDRVVCGDVGFGKTEVALRAAFAAAQDGHQVAVLVPTTLLAQQHYQSFLDRFADWPVRVESLSRFGGRAKQKKVLEGLADGTLDVVIGTHRLLGDDVRFKRLGLVIVDEEHRFGVRHKERLKKLRAEVDLLTLTATPIPRTLNMAMARIRDLSIIATPPTERLSVKTFVTEWNTTLLHEACLREIKRGGQVYFIHNNVDTIEKTARKIEEMVPEASVRVAHGQMPESRLEKVMLDFYHRRFNVLVCTTIIESGIDVPTANTIIIDRADRFGLAQLHQLRGRVGRSHHRAYAYLIAPPKGVMTADAAKRLEAIESLEDLGAGFTLATHDLEIRGAGELLGEEQSGQIQEVGFTLYTDLLERAVEDLKTGREPDMEAPLHHGAEVDLKVPALLPADYVPDVHMRLILYKRISSARSHDQLRELQVEMIDRFGLLPVQAKNLFRITEIKLKADRLGIRKVECGPGGGRLFFSDRPAIEPASLIHLVQTEPETYRLVGEEKLRFVELELPEPEDRFEFVETLLDRLGYAETAAAESG